MSESDLSHMALLQKWLKDLGCHSIALEFYDTSWMDGGENMKNSNMKNSYLLSTASNQKWHKTSTHIQLARSSHITCLTANLVFLCVQKREKIRCGWLLIIFTTEWKHTGNSSYLKQDKKTQNKVTSFGTIFLQLLDHFSAPLNSKGFKNGASISFFKSLFSHSFLNTN